MAKRFGYEDDYYSGKNFTFSFNASTPENKNYYVVGDAGFARPSNTLKIICNFFLIGQSMNESIECS